MMPLLFVTLGACVPQYAHLGPIEPEDLWAPLPVQHTIVQGMDIAFIDSGGEGDPIVLVHGLSSSMGFWEYQVEELAKSHRVLALDLPGYGASARPDAPCTPPWYADVVDAWMFAVGVERGVIMGHSMGGQVAMELALTHPERVERLVLAAPAGIETFSPGAGRFMKGFWTERRALESSEEQVRANFETMVFNRMDEGVERLIQERVRLGQSARFAGTSVAVSRSIAGMIDHPVGERARGITVPTLIVVGTEDRMIPNPVFNGGRPRAIAERAHALIPHSRLVMIDGAGHTVHHDAPRAFNRAVEEFLP
jgi:pimeloyl-ACP methyl ester carboxylesterase